MTQIEIYNKHGVLQRTRDVSTIHDVKQVNSELAVVVTPNNTATREFVKLKTYKRLTQGTAT